MKTSAMLFSMLFFVGVSLYGCHSGDNASAGEAVKTSRKGGVGAMRTYYMGRFALDVPVEMKQAVQAQSLRLAEVEDFLWPQNQQHHEEREKEWRSRVAVIKQMKLPKKVTKHIIEEVPLDIDKRWAKGVLFYGNYIVSDEGTWDVLVDAGTSGLWLRYDGVLEARKEMREWVVSIAKEYHPNVSPTAVPAGNWFYLKHGAINLQYKRQEKTYSRFEDYPLSVKLEVEMNETHEVEKLGMAERLAASIATNFAPGVDVEKLRSRSRTAAGLKGEELVMRMSARGEDTQLNFSWEYRGEVDSGERPEILITMEAPDGNVDAKLKLWDQVLDSFKPIYR